MFSVDDSFIRLLSEFDFGFYETKIENDIYGLILVRPESFDAIKSLRDRKNQNRMTNSVVSVSVV